MDDIVKLKHKIFEIRRYATSITLNRNSYEKLIDYFDQQNYLWNSPPIKDSYNNYPRICRVYGVEIKCQM